MDTRTKIISTAEAARLAGKDAILVAGAFDVLQASHVRFLQKVREDGRPVVVAVYADAVLGAPILPEQARAQLVAAVGAVDNVVVWGEKDLDALVAQLRPLRVETAVPEDRNIIEEVLERHR